MRWTALGGYSSTSSLLRWLTLQDKRTLFRASGGTVIIVALSSCLVLVACNEDPMSSIEEIRGILKMAEDLKKVDQAVLDWYEEHPGETRRLHLDLDVDYDALDLEPETSPYDVERRALNERINEIYNEADARGEPRTSEENDEIRRLREEEDAAPATG